MSPKEQAELLVVQMYGHTQTSAQAKNCALVAVGHLIHVAWWSSTGEMDQPYRKSQKEYWMEVKKEIEKL